MFFLLWFVLLNFSFSFPTLMDNILSYPGLCSHQAKCPCPTPDLRVSFWV